MQENRNEYRQCVFEPQFKTTQLYQQMCEDFDEIDFTKSWSNPLHNFTITPRQDFGQRHSIFSAVPFYYLEFLTRENPPVIYDIGCGWNIFKRYIPNVIGISPENPEENVFFGDIHDLVDDGFVQGHQGFFACAFSINALHFIPLSRIKKRVDEFYSMLSPNGVGWLTFNIERMIERDLETFGNKDIEYLENYIRLSLHDPKIDYMVFDLDLSCRDEFMNGNVRLVMRKGH